ncbi:MAG: signal peptide peptidase SppA [Alphaproteobacteria bacterium]|nr:signal peptide peptidase SppA [Alphaproteobacteria bacterium]
MTPRRYAPRLPLHLLVPGLGLLSAPALGADETPERPVLPAFSSAGEDGAATIWSNPASLGLDPDPSAWLSWEQELPVRPASLSGAFQAGPFATGVYYDIGGGDRTWLGLTSGLGLRLSRRVALGVGVGWQIPEGPENNFLTWDLGLTWRPAHWLGLSLLAENLNDPAPELGVTQRFGGGLAWRPFQGRLLVGVDYRQADIVNGSAGSFRGSVRLEATDGLVLRGYGDDDGEIGAGLELFWGRTGAGAYGLADINGAAPGRNPVGMAYLTTAEGDRSFFGQGRKVPEFVLDESFPYQPARGLLAPPSESWLHLLERMRDAIDDPRVKGMVLHIDRPPASWARVEELRRLVSEAQSRGKVVVAYLDKESGNAAYLLASAADRVYLHPAASLDLVGLSMGLTYLRGTLDLVGVEPQYAKRSEYKSAPEQYTRSGPSEPAREQLDALLDTMAGTLVAGVAQGRGRTEDQVTRLVDQGPFTAAEAEARGLVDGLVYPDALEETMEEAFRRRFQLVPDYHLDDRVTGWPASRELAVIYIDGVITTGPSVRGGLLGGRTAGSDTIARQLDQARRDEAVEAVVLRVDSPGGSAFASDEIWRAAQRLEESGKPFIVSMGGVAASGGYYVSAGADTIFAEPTTITGSIGVYGGKFSLGGLYDKLGVETEILTRGRHAAMYSLSRPMDDGELSALDRLIGATYDQFKDRVAEGRGMTKEQVEEVARGRVWSGRDAKEVGLVDELGGLEDAIAHARAEAGIPEGAVVELVTYDDRFFGPLPRRSVRVGAGSAALSSALARLPLPSPAAALPAVPVPQELSTLLLLAEDPVLAMLPWQLEVE